MTPQASGGVQPAAPVALLRQEDPAGVAVVADLPVPARQLLVRLRGVAGIPADPCQTACDIAPTGAAASSAGSVSPKRMEP